MRSYAKLLLVIIVLLTAAASVRAAVPHEVNYQGRLTDSEGGPLDTTVSITFTLYNVPSGGTVFWSETHAVDVVDGLFEVTLGLYEEKFDTEQKWLGIQVGDNPEITPRTRFQSVPYAFRVETIDGAEGGTVLGDVYIEGDVNIEGDIIVTSDTIFVGDIQMAPTTRYYTIPPSGFVGMRPTTTVEYMLSMAGRDSVFFYEIGDHPAIVAPLHLPHGAVVIKVSAYVSGGTGGDPYYELWVKRNSVPPASGSAILGYIQMDWPFTDGELMLTGLSDNTIDNELYSYLVGVVFEVGGGASCYGIVVEYVVTSPMP